jgi:hypothetical protein
VERAEVLTTYLGRRSHLQRRIEHAPQIYDGRETSTREAPKDVRKPTRLPDVAWENLMGVAGQCHRRWTSTTAPF